MARRFPPPADGGPPMLGVHLLCPFGVNTAIMDTAKVMGDPATTREDVANGQAQTLAKYGLSPEALVEDRLYEGIKRGIFYIVGYDTVNDLNTIGAVWEQRTRDLLLGRQPRLWSGPDKEARAEFRELRKEASAEIAKGNWAEILKGVDSSKL